MMFGKRKKNYTRPRKAYDSARIENENELVKKYGLKNKREIWKAEAKVDVLRNRAKNLIGKDTDLQNKFVETLQKIRLPVEKISDVLALDREDLLKRRLQSVVAEKKLASTPKKARQLVTHKHVVVGDHVVNIPSYIVDKDEENKISLRNIKPEGNNHGK